MFEPLPSFIRLARVRRNLSQDRLAKMANVSRKHLVALEKGENVTLAFLVKVAGALNLTELPLGGIGLRNAPVDLDRIKRARDAIAPVEEVLSEIVGWKEKAKAASGAMNALLDEVLTRPGDDSP